MDASRDVNAGDRLNEARERAMLQEVRLQLLAIRKRVYVLQRRGMDRADAIRQAIDEQMAREE